MAITKTLNWFHPTALITINAFNAVHLLNAKFGSNSGCFTLSP